MTTTTRASGRSYASLKLQKKVPALITQAQNIVQAMTNNPSFPAPTPSLATVTDAIHQLDVAETATLSRTKGAAATRNDKRTALVKLLELLKGHIQNTADANVETAAAVIQSTGLTVKKHAVKPPRVFAAKAGAVSGSVNLVAHSAAHRASYEWQYSTDTGKTWLGAPSTLQSKTTIPGLTPGATAMFRYRSVTKKGEGDWSQPTSLLVH